MNRQLLSVAVILMMSQLCSAQRYMTRTGRITFDATSPKSPEKIVGINNEVASILVVGTGDFVFQVPIKSFKLEKELMQQHFNENYMESDKFPKSEFKGKVEGLSNVNFTKDGSYPVTVKGQLTIHGATNSVSVPGTILVKGGTSTAQAKFSVKLADYNVSIPSLVADKLSKEALITVDVQLAAK